MFYKKLKTALEPWHLLKHPFYQAWMNGELSRGQLQTYAAQYYPHVKAFPRYVSATHSLCEDDKARPALAHNLADEEGVINGTPHPELWLRFSESLGLDRKQVQSAEATGASSALVEGYAKFSKASYAEGLGALIAYEYQVPEIALSKIAGLKKHYGVTSGDGLSFFEVHAEADVYHSQACAEAADRLNDDDQSRAQVAALKSAELLWNFLTEAYEST